MSTTLAAPPAWPIPVRSVELTRRQQADTLNAQYPDALAWYGEKAGLWMAAPSGADGLIQAHTAAGLAHLLELHYKQFLPETPRPAPALPTQRRTPGGDRPPARRMQQQRPPGGGSTSAAGHGRHESVRRPGRFRRAMAGLGLLAAA